MSELEFKEAHKTKHGEQLDSMSISVGSAAKGTAIALKTYYDVHDIDDAQQKIENTLKIRQYLIGKGFMQ